MIPDGRRWVIPTIRIFLDPPRHTAQRKPLVKDFLPKAARALQPRIEQISSDLIDRAAADGGCDLVEDLSGVLASHVIAEVLGIPHEDGERLYHLTEVIQSGEPLNEGRGLEAVTEMFEFAHSVWVDRRANPRADLATRVAHGNIGDESIDETDFALHFLLLINAGGDTIRNVIGGGMLELLDDTEQYRMLREDPETLLPTAVEEMVRWVSPINYQRRRATKHTSLRGQPVAEGGEGRHVLRGRELRPQGLQRAATIRHHPFPEPARRLRRRGSSLLPRSARRAGRDNRDGPPACDTIPKHAPCSATRLEHVDDYERPGERSGRVHVTDTGAAPARSAWTFVRTVQP